MFFEKQTNVFVNNFETASKTADIDAVHDMRVSLKRIDTGLRMLNHDKKANYRLKKCFNPLKELFRIAGPLRDFQVQCQIIENIQDSLFIEEQLKALFYEKKELLIRNFYIVYKTFDLLKTKRSFRLIEHYIKNISTEEIRQQIEAYEKNRFSELKQLSDPENLKYNLHKARRMVKDLAYLKEMALTESPTEDKDYLAYKQTGHILGDWHDRAVMLNFIEEYRFRDPYKEQPGTESLITRISSERERLKEQFYEEFRSWIL